MLMFAKPLYMSIDLEKDGKQLLRKLRRRKITLPVTIVYWDVDLERMEMTQSTYLLQPYYHKKKLIVLAITHSREQAMDYLVSLTNRLSSEQEGSVDYCKWIKTIQVGKG